VLQIEILREKLGIPAARGKLIFTCLALSNVRLKQYQGAQ
jgi:hypothetical protein